MERTVAALYVDTRFGPYPSIAGVECWGIKQDARTYAGPHPIVAHPSCAWWGRFGYRASNEHADCGPRAVEQVRTYGGVLEHPRYSRLWDHCKLPAPGKVDAYGGRTVEVRQCDWGHKAEKATWLYIVGVDELPPTPPTGKFTHAIASKALPNLRTRERHLTPPAMAAWLVEVARRSNIPST